MRVSARAAPTPTTLAAVPATAAHAQRSAGGDDEQDGPANCGTELSRGVERPPIASPRSTSTGTNAAPALPLQPPRRPAVHRRERAHPPGGACRQAHRDDGPAGEQG